MTEETVGAVAGDVNNGLLSSSYWLKLDTLTTSTDGIISKSGLANGTYYLVETKTWEGYNLLNAPIKVDLKVQYTTSIASTWEWTEVDGVQTLVKHTIDTNNTIFSETDDENNLDGYQEEEIVNRTGFTLPTTGGVGTYIFVFVGVSMMAAAVILFFTTKKKEAQKN